MANRGSNNVILYGNIYGGVHGDGQVYNINGIVGTIASQPGARPMIIIRRDDGKYLYSK